MNDSSSFVASEATFFIEAEEVRNLISSLAILETNSSSTHATATATAADKTAQYSNDDDDKDKDKNFHAGVRNSQLTGNEALSRLRVIFDKYLECPTLLDPHLERMCTALSSKALEIIHELYGSFTNSNNTSNEHDNNNDNDNAGDSDNDADDNESELKLKLARLNNDKIKILKLHLTPLYALSKVRGKKHIQKYLSHNVQDVEPVLFVLRHMEGIKETNSIEIGKAFVWESVFVLLLWVGMLSLVPFDLNTIDSTIIVNKTYANDVTVIDTNTDDDADADAEKKDASSSKTTLISFMIMTTKKHLSDAGATREASASSLASLLSRPDLEEAELASFIDYSNYILRDYLWSLNHNGQSNPTTATIMSTTNTSTFQNSVFLVMGIVQTLANVFKTGSRMNLMRHLKYIELLWEQAIILSDKASPKRNTNSKRGFGTVTSSNNDGGTSILRKLLVKLFARVGCSYLPPRIAPWRYQRGRRSLLENLTSTRNNQEKNSNSNNNDDNKNDDASGISPSRNNIKSNTNIAPNEKNDDKTSNNNHGEDVKNMEKQKDETDDFFLVPDQVEDSMAQLVQALTDQSTIVRWSAAKGIGRVTERLPAICADDVLDAILELCTKDYENDNTWHGSCLTLAELARRGLLLPKRLNEIIPIVIRAIQYDLPRGSHSVGSHVRDAACYVCWAFARAYAPSILKPYVKELSQSIVLASLFDREINCRRAASASFQECVGRQGADNFKHGIAILTTADYFSLGNRVDAYTTVARKVAEFDEYRHAIIDHLYDEKLFHWDIEIRKLASISLGMLTSLEPQYFIKTVLPNLIPLCIDENLFVRHGALIGIAEIILTLEDVDGIDNESLAQLVFKIEKERLYRGRGGEIMRSAVSRYIECMSKSNSNIPLTVKQQVGLLDSLDVNLKHPNEDIQNAAAAALSALMNEYFPLSDNGPSERLQNRVVNSYIKIIYEDENAAATRGFSLALGHLPAKLISPTTEILDTVIDCLSYAANPETKVGGQGDAETRRNATESLVRVCDIVGISTITSNGNRMGGFTPFRMNKSQLKKVFDALLLSMRDYNTDRRGDVGSWSRIAAMKGLVSVTFLAVKASNIPYDDLLSEVTESYDSPVMVPSFASRIECSFEVDADNQVKRRLDNNEPYRQYNEASLDIYFDDQLCSEVLGVLLKQLAEKLDAVRSIAGLCLEQLILGPNIIPFVPRKTMLLEAIKYEQQPQINWGQPESTFPILMRVVNIDAFFYPIISGLVISVGGLTESVTKHSAKSLLDYIRALKKSKSMVKVAKIGKAFIRLFDEHTKDGRVILPLLVTLDKLLSHRSLDELLQEQRSDFSNQLVARIRKESSQCTDIKRVMAIIPVALGLLDASDIDLVHNTLLPFIMRLLVHRYPRIRRCTAEQLYVKLLEDSSVVPNTEHIDKVVSLLSEVAWDREKVRQSRNQVADLLGIALTEKDRVGPAQKKVTKTAVDEFASYQSLVETAGR